MDGYLIGEIALADDALNAVLIRYPVLGSGRVLEPLQRVVDRRDDRADRALQRLAHLSRRDLRIVALDNCYLNEGVRISKQVRWMVSYGGKWTGKKRSTNADRPPQIHSTYLFRSTYHTLGPVRRPILVLAPGASSTNTTHRSHRHKRCTGSGEGC